MTENELLSIEQYSVSDLIVKLRETKYIFSTRDFWFAIINSNTDINSNTFEGSHTFIKEKYHAYIRKFTHRLFDVSKSKPGYSIGRIERNDLDAIAINNVISIDLLEQSNIPIRNKIHEYIKTYFFNYSERINSNILNPYTYIFNSIDLYYFTNPVLQYSGSYYKYSFDKIHLLLNSVNDKYNYSTDLDLIDLDLRFEKCTIYYCNNGNETPLLTFDTIKKRISKHN